MRRAAQARVLLLLVALFSSHLSPAHAIDYTITYDANSDYVGSVNQRGATSGSVPTSPAQASGSTYTVLGPGNLARQGFTFAGWNTAANGTGANYSPGNSFLLTSNQTLYAKWTIPQAARLIGSGGSLVTVTNPNNVASGSTCIGTGMRGITSDGTFIYYRPSSNTSYICKATPSGTLVSLHLITGLSAIAGDQMALVYGNGCLFIRVDPNSTFTSIKCISISDWALYTISLNNSYPLPSGGAWLLGNFIQFPDGRIGSVGASVAAASWPGGVGTGAGQCPTSMYCKRLRLYSVSGTGGTLTTTYSTDFVLADTVAGWPDDDHGIATDGTYLYQIRHISGYKVWALRSDGPSYLVFNGDGSGACGATTGITGTLCTITYPINGLSSGGAFANGTYLGRAHDLNKYLIGDYSGSSQFWLSDASVPPSGPGNPDVTAPSFTSTDTFTVSENIATTFNAAVITINDSATLAIAVGLDGSQFNIVIADTATAYIRFKVSPDFEGPTDSGNNNQYDFSMTATDLAGNTRTRTFNIRVTNLNESANIPAPVISGIIYKGVVTSLSVTVNTPGKVRFFVDGKRIPGCLTISTTGSYPNFTATCSWRPSKMSRQFITAQLSPSDNTFTGGTSPALIVLPVKRTTLR